MTAMPVPRRIAVISALLGGAVVGCQGGVATDQTRDDESVAAEQTSGQDEDPLQLDGNLWVAETFPLEDHDRTLKPGEESAHRFHSRARVKSLGRMTVTWMDPRRKQSAVVLGSFMTPSEEFLLRFAIWGPSEAKPNCVVELGVEGGGRTITAGRATIPPKSSLLPSDSFREAGPVSRRELAVAGFETEVILASFSWNGPMTASFAEGKYHNGTSLYLTDADKHLLDVRLSDWPEPVWFFLCRMDE